MLLASLAVPDLLFELENSDKAEHEAELTWKSKIKSSNMSRNSHLHPTVGMYVEDGGFVLYSDKKLEMQLLPDCNGPTTTIFLILAAIGVRYFKTIPSQSI